MFYYLPQVLKIRDLDFVLCKFSPFSFFHSYSRKKGSVAQQCFCANFFRILSFLLYKTKPEIGLAGSLVRPKVVRSVHYCPTTKKTLERRYTDMTSYDPFPSSAIYPTKDEDGEITCHLIIHLTCSFCFTEVDHVHLFYAIFI